MWEANSTELYGRSCWLAIIPPSHVFISHLLTENCALIRSGGKKGIKGKFEAEGKSLSCFFNSNFTQILGTQIQRKALKSEKLPHPLKNPQRKRTNRPRKLQKVA
jgi:hypothetical protein